MRDLEYPLAQAGGIRSRGTRSAGLGLASLVAVLVLLQAGGDEPGLADPARTARSVALPGAQENRAALLTGPTPSLERGVPSNAQAPDVWSTPLRSELSTGDDDQLSRAAQKRGDAGAAVAAPGAQAGAAPAEAPPDLRFARESLTEIGTLPSRPPARTEPNPATAALVEPSATAVPALLDAEREATPVAKRAQRAATEEVVTPARKLGAVRAEPKPRLLGRWAPKPEACSPRSTGTPFLALTIGPRVAKAGPAACEFGTLKQAGDEFRGPAACRNGAERWTANLKLVVKGNKLIWTSERGTQAYFRCG